MYFPKAHWNHYSRILEHAENHFQRAFNVTQQLYILVLHWAKMFVVNFKMAAVFLVKRTRFSASLTESSQALRDNAMILLAFLFFKDGSQN
jgi:hypothetical protein